MTRGTTLMRLAALKAD